MNINIRHVASHGKKKQQLLDTRSLLFVTKTWKQEFLSSFFVMNVTGTFHDDAMLRQGTESVMINKIDEKKLINSKNEWNYVRIPRSVITL